METLRLPHVPPVFDLSGIAEARRARTWVDAAPSFFPGLSIKEMAAKAPVGEIRSISMGGGSLWSIHSAPVVVGYTPSGASREPPGFTLMMQLEGRMGVDQNRRHCELRPSDMCLVDERFPFRLDTPECSRIAFLRMPRRAVLSRHPHLEHRTAGAIDPDDAGAALLREMMERTIDAAADLREEQRASVLAAMVHLLGAAAAPRAAQADDAGWRVRAALAHIEMNLADDRLTPEQVARAQGVSRRRLDQILRRALGVSGAGQIWDRRLEQAAADLVDIRHAGQTVSQIAFACGFEDAAHFSRAFKRRFGRTPRDWRAMGGGSLN